MSTLRELRQLLGAQLILPEELTSINPVLTNNIGWQSPFPKTILTQVAEPTDYVIVPGPPFPLSLMEVHNVDPTCFFHAREDWLWYINEPFAGEKSALPGWYCLRINPVPRSVGRSWEKQKELLQPGEYVPSCATVAWVMVIVAKVRGVKLFTCEAVRTGSRNTADQCVAIGRYDVHGVELEYAGDHDEKSTLGLAAAKC